MAGQGYKSPFGPAEVLEEPDIRRLLAGCSARAPTGVRNRALILTLWRAGLRIDEALTLAPQDVKLDDEQPVIRVRRAKGAVQRRVHPHAFRATLAVEMCVEGVPLPAIRDVLGHTNLSVTDAYLRRVFPQQAIDAVRNRRSATPQQDRSGELRALLDQIAPADAARLAQLLARLAP